MGGGGGGGGGGGEALLGLLPSLLQGMWKKRFLLINLARMLFNS